ncbi:MAG: glycine cleavage system protein GcvH [Terriglobales bacterium]
MAYPSDYRYTKEHEWIARDGTVGITDYAQQQLGDVVYVELPKVGSAVKKGESFGTVESVKAVSEVFSPADGTVREINEALAQSPEMINQDPHGKAWLIRIDVRQPSDLDGLLTADKYDQFLAEEQPH